MSKPTAAGFLELYTEFSGVAEAEVERWITNTTRRFRAARFGAVWADFVYLVTAHQLSKFGTHKSTNAADHQVRGPIASESVLDQSRSYGSTLDLSRVPGNLMWLASTEYGLQAIGLVKSRSATRPTVIRTGSSA